MPDFVLQDSVLNLMREPDRDHVFLAQRIAPIPLSFSRVNGCRPVTSQTLLFRLPMELVQEVVTYLDTADLKSLALVDRDCRLLARSRLFASVVLDYSVRKWELLDELSREAQERERNGGASSSPSIGACIRHLTVQTDSDAIVPQHLRELEEEEEGKEDISRNISLALTEQEEFMEDYCGIYLPAIAKALRFSLPNLDGLDWGDFIPIPQYMLTAIASSPIRHLGLHRAILGPDCEHPVLPLEQRQRWVLRSLELWLMPPPGVDYRNHDWSHVARFSKSFFEEVAPTLERLSCDDRAFPEDCVIRFPRLHTLSLDTWAAAKDSLFESFFPADAGNSALRFLAINSNRDNGPTCMWIWKSLARRGHLRGLEELNLHQVRQAHKVPIMAFLLANPQLKSLLMFSREPEFFTTTILPFLASNLKFLTSLVVTLTSPEIPLPFLAAIGLIPSLTSLWIALEDPFWVHKKWIVDNPPSIAALSPLRNLTRLALSEEADETTLPKSRSPILDGCKLTGTKGLRGWRHGHHERVRKIVEEYVTVVKSLRWVYLGKLVHSVVGGAVVLEGGSRRVYCPGEPWDSSFIVGPGRDS